MGGGPDRVALLEAAHRVGDASRSLLLLISPKTEQCAPAVPCMTVEGTERSFVTSVADSSIVDWKARDQLLSVTKVSYSP